MPELRWILLGLGVLFCLGLWWWEARRGRQAADSRASLNPAEGFTSTSTTVVGDAMPGETTQRAEAAPAPTDDYAERLAWRDPPVVLDTPEDDAEPMMDFAAERPARGAPNAPTRVEPVIGDAAAAVGAVSAAGPIETPASRPPPEEKIVTLRVAAPPLERFEGRLLIGALRSAGLEHGKFSIFHKTGAEGRTLFSVASLVEPGTFELDAIDGRRFPGVSFFAVLTSDSDSGATLEDMLGTARTLASSLHGTLQDERGAPMSPQKLADLRADVAAWARRTHRASAAY